ncbi:uncharacterized protein BJ171DRAFT_597121 [Polychytrium aggregatum]|uniref:uncharacterized protein n=1 Tax=Polychytrium aggregatum TaxID=110093 RepID=UPI0022FDD763|nr:uncharacterized protein BJ171DRAFT_597121 [Polychytrium aggregatum]KAI9207002.1 hypothetical protein BJ171DRAFT_597121 [Polychytrium aggregatum]
MEPPQETRLALAPPAAVGPGNESFIQRKILSHWSKFSSVTASLWFAAVAEFHQIVEEHRQRWPIDNPEELANLSQEAFGMLVHIGAIIFVLWHVYFFEAGYVCDRPIDLYLMIKALLDLMIIGGFICVVVQSRLCPELYQSSNFWISLSVGALMAHSSLDLLNFFAGQWWIAGSQQCHTWVKLLAMWLIFSRYVEIIVFCIFRFSTSTTSNHQPTASSIIHGLTKMELSKLKVVLWPDLASAKQQCPGIDASQAQTAPLIGDSAAGSLADPESQPIDEEYCSICFEPFTAGDRHVIGPKDRDPTIVKIIDRVVEGLIEAEAQANARMVQSYRRQLESLAPELLENAREPCI